MVDCGLHNQPSLRLQYLLDLLIRRLDMLPDEFRHFTCKASRLVNRTRGHFFKCQNPIRNRDAMIVLTECRRLMDDARTILGCHIRISYDPECFVLELDTSMSKRRMGLHGYTTCLFRKIVEQWYISPPFHIGTLEYPNLLEFGFLWVFVKGGQEVLVQDEVLISFLIMDLDIIEFGVYAERKVGREGPGCGSPRQEGRFGVIDEGERNSDWWPKVKHISKIGQ